MKKQTSRKKSNDAVVRSSLPPVPEIPKGQILVLDKEEIPIAGLFGAGPEISHPKEFALIDSMAVGQSAAFHKGKQNIIDSIRMRLKKLGDKKFVVKKVSAEFSRIWRVKDGAVTRYGGRQASEKGAKTTKIRRHQKKIKNNGTLLEPSSINQQQ